MRSCCSAGSSNRSSQPSCRSSAARAGALDSARGQKEVRRLDPPPAPGPGRWRERQAGRPAAQAAGSNSTGPAPAREPNGWRAGAGGTHSAGSRSARRAEVLAISPGGPNSRCAAALLRLTGSSSAIESFSWRECRPSGIAAPKVQIQIAASHRRSGPGGRTAQTVDVRGLRVMKRSRRGGNAAWCPGPCLGESMASAQAKLKRGLRQWLGHPCPWRRAASATLKRAMVDRGCSVVAVGLGLRIGAVPVSAAASASPWPPPAGASSPDCIEESGQPALSIPDDRLARAHLLGGRAHCTRCPPSSRRQLISASLPRAFKRGRPRLGCCGWQRGRI